MKGTLRATVKIAGAPQREKRFAPGTPARVIKAWKIHTRAKLLKRYPAATDRTATTGTLKADALRYLGLCRHLADPVTRRAEIWHWITALGDGRHRHTLTREDVLRVRGSWVAAGRAPKSINNRVSALRDLFRKLDGDDEPTPCDRVKPLPFSKVPPEVIPAATVNAVLTRLASSTAKHAPQDRARLMVLASTGKRPCEVERAQPGDVDLLRRVWTVRDAKGGWGPGLYLNDDMLAAWQAFYQAAAWGPFPDHFPRRLRLAGWPAKVKPYHLRHTTWITASERGADLADIQAGAGHRNIATTRRHYVPVLSSRMQQLSERLEGRFGWQASLAGQSNRH